jgi:glycosyltransferase involved in cell wall biosynthesis
MSVIDTYSFAIVVPAYNEQATIQAVIRSIQPFCPRIIVVDDASVDATAELAKAAGAEVVRHTANQGKANALLSGFRAALASDVDFVITMDGDGQHDPDGIAGLINAHQQYGPESFVIAARLEDRSHAPKTRVMANKIADFWVSWAAGQPVVDSQSGFRLYPRSLLQRLPATHPSHSGFVFESEVIIQASEAQHPLVFVLTRSIYPTARRASHFNAWYDISRITVMIAKRLLRGMLKLPNLYRALTLTPNIQVANKPVQNSTQYLKQP